MVERSTDDVQIPPEMANTLEGIRRLAREDAQGAIDCLCDVAEYQERNTQRTLLALERITEILERVAR